MSKAESLYRMQALDQELDGAQKRLLEIESLLQGTPALKHARGELSKADSALKAALAALKALELDGQTLADKIAEEEQRLYEGKIKSPKEMLDIQHELDVLKRRRAIAEEAQLRAMEQVEQLRADEVACRTAFQHAERQFLTDNVHLREERDALIRAARAQIEQRKAMSAALPADTLGAYTTIRAKKSNRVAVALVRNGACSQCGEITSSVLMQQARTGLSLAICSNCGRILYAQ
jgi:predicted  nucleic acid-binding Zn-ribbon protein